MAEGQENISMISELGKTKTRSGIQSNIDITVVVPKIVPATPLLVGNI